MNSIWQAALRAVYPQRMECHACGTPLASWEGLLCDACARALLMQAFECEREQTVVDAELAFAASAYRYAAPADQLVKALKFGSDRSAARPLAEGMAAVYARQPALRTAELCVAVPVHAKRERVRGYNQAEVLAEAFCAMTGMPLFPDALLRVRHQHSQIGRGRAGRTQNIAGAFAMSRNGRRAVRGRTVLLMDDVLTTGATAAECARVLTDAGARRVLLLTACRA